MRRSTPFRNLLIACAVIAAVLCLSGAQWFAPQAGEAIAAPARAPLQQGGFRFNPDAATATAQAGQSVVISTLSLVNQLDADASFDLEIQNLPTGWQRSFTTDPLFVPEGGSVRATLRLDIPANAAARTYNLTLTATRQNISPPQTASAFLTITVTPPATNTPTPSTPTPTTGPTPTALPPCQGGRENDDPGNDLGSANLIRVNAPERHGICSPEPVASPDVDWYKFGAGAGKVYTIDINEMSAGLDLIIELYDAQGNFLTGNDDFFLRTPPNPFDLRPRIQSWRAPYDGIFYFLVRDKINTGGGDRTYVVEVRGESFGPTPTQISELCLDLYEPDGLPEDYKEIFPNEIQPRHVLCPTGDADWVRFFGKAGKTYFLYTDTRPYRNNPDFNRETQAGADTLIFLFDRDGVSQIAASDDIPDSLDSEITFTPNVDGFYFAQVKNTGDLGSQFIEYDLILKLCVAGDTSCGRAPDPVIAPTRPGGSGVLTPTPTDDTFDAGTATPTRTPTLEPTEEEEFVFSRVWQRADRPIAERRATRTWLWGPRGLLNMAESYAEAPGGVRDVVYYDKARMEITDPNGNRSSPWFVTTGLLVVEMIRGQVQLGDNQFAERGAAAIPIAGDQNDPRGPTYASFAGVTSRSRGDRTGEYVGETLNRAGEIGDYTGPRRAEIRLARYVPQTGYNIPRVFWDYLNAGGTVYENGRFRSGTLFDWVFTMGYPISDPYWAKVRIGGVERDVLVQAFERRVLTYTPDNPAGWQVEMGNVGRHYYAWRYGQELP